MEKIVVTIQLILFGISWVVCEREVEISKANQLPKFNDAEGDEHKSIIFQKTRTIGDFHKN